uniref:Uncharacterized protein n=1 Tax=Plectus sambesii TaxID=2011161 RepID=A0A914XAC4_9BILA
MAFGVILAMCCLAATASAAPRTKRQLSPAVALENELHPLVHLMSVQDMIKRTAGPSYQLSDRLSPLLLEVQANGKRHAGPSSAVDERLAFLAELQKYGKRQLAPSADISDQFDLLSSLHSIGKRSAVSPADDLEQRLMVSQLVDIGKKRSAAGPSALLASQLELNKLLDDAGR